METPENTSIQQTFPQELDASSATSLVTEAFGWAPASFASEFVILLAFAAVQPDILKFTRDTSELAVGAAIAVVPLLLFLYEFRRRRKRRTFVRLANCNDVGIYIRGRLDRVISANSIGIYTRLHTRTLMYLMFTAAPLIGLIASFFVQPKPGTAPFTTAEKVALFASVLCSTALLFSVIRTRLLCKELLMPRKQSRRLQFFLVRKNDAPTLLREF